MITLFECITSNMKSILNPKLTIKCNSCMRSLSVITEEQNKSRGNKRSRSHCASEKFLFEPVVDLVFG